MDLEDITNSTAGEIVESHGLWIIGATTAFLGTFVRNLGVNIQKYSLMQDSMLPIEQQTPYMEQKTWWMGLGMVVVGSIGDFIALGFAAESIVAPIGSATLVANVIFAHFWLKEHITQRDLIATGLIISGSILTVMFGDHSENQYTIFQLEMMHFTPTFIIYTIACIVAIIAVYIPYKIAEPLRERLDKLEQDMTASRKTEALAECARIQESLSVVRVEYKKWEQYHPLCGCALAGIIGGQNILFGKIMAELFATSFRGDNQFIYFVTYLYALCLVVTILLQIHFLAKALKYFDALYVVPVFQCFWIGTSTIAGAAYFKEFDHFSVLQWFAFPIGIGISLYGVYMMVGRKHGQGAHEFSATRLETAPEDVSLLSDVLITDDLEDSRYE